MGVGRWPGRDIGVRNLLNLYIQAAITCTCCEIITSWAVFHYFGGIVLEASTNFLKGEGLQWLFDLEVIVEETMEMPGAMLIVYAHASWLDKFNEQKHLIEQQQQHTLAAHEHYFSGGAGYQLQLPGFYLRLLIPT